MSAVKDENKGIVAVRGSFNSSTSVSTMYMRKAIDAPDADKVI